jgi:hypothetical protein
MERSPEKPRERRVVCTHELRRPASKWQAYGRFDSQMKEFERINQCAYFDYQREHVFVRTNKRFVAINRRTKERLRRPSVNKVIELSCSQCVHCGGRRLYAGRRTSRTIIDLKFSASGMKRWVTRYVSRWYRCPKCASPSSRMGGQLIGTRMVAILWSGVYT